MSQRVSVEDLNGWQASNEFCSSYGRGSAKCLRVICDETGYAFSVVDHKKVVYFGKNIKEAVRIYNECK